LDKGIWARVVVEDDEVSAKLDENIPDWPRLMEGFNALTWVLSRNPFEGTLIPNTEPELYIYRQQGDAEANLPNIVVTYTHDANKVEIRSIRFFSVHN
jgi:hypothetical protein